MRSKTFYIIVCLCLSHLCMAQFRNTNRDYHPKWYPNGKSLIFYSYRMHQPGIYRINIETDAETLVTNKLGSHPIISPDGKKIVYCLRDESGISRLNIIDAQSGDLINIIDHKDPKANANHPIWLNNDRIAFDLDNREFSNIMSVHSDGTGLEVVVEDMRAGTAAPFDKGNKLVFVVRKENKNSTVYTADISGENIKILIDGESRFSTPDISPDGSKIIYTSNETGKNQVYVMDLVTKLTTQLTFGADCHFPRWSPEGSKIAFASESYGFSEIVVMNADGSKMRNITKNSVEHGKPLPFLNGEYLYIGKEHGHGQLVRSGSSMPLTDDRYDIENFDIDYLEKNIYFTTNNQGMTTLYKLSVMDRKVNEVRSIEGDIISLSISHNGEQIAYELGNDGQSDIYMLQIKSGIIEPIMISEKDEGNPTFHPTENKLIYNSDANGNYDLMVLDLSSRESDVFVGSEKHEVFADVSPNGNKVVFTTIGDNIWDIDIMDINTGKRSNLTSLPNHEFYPKWTKDSASVLFQSTSTGSMEVFMVDINTKEIKQLTRQ